MKRSSTVLWAAVFAASACAVTAQEDDGAAARAAFFECAKAAPVRPRSYANYDAPSLATHCYDALEAAVPGWCPLMDNQIRSHNGNAMFAAAADLTPKNIADKIELNGASYSIKSFNPAQVSVEEQCPDLASLSVPRGVSKEAMCRQRLGWAAFAQARWLSQREGNQ